MIEIDIDEGIARWFDYEGGGRVQLKTISVADFRAIQKQTVKKKVDYKRVEGTPGRFEYEVTDQDLQNELYWDAVIVSWDGLGYKDPKTKEMVFCTPDNCTKEMKVFLMTNSKKFLNFVVESLKVLSDDEAAQAETEQKN